MFLFSILFRRPNVYRNRAAEHCGSPSARPAATIPGCRLIRSATSPDRRRRAVARRRFSVPMASELSSSPPSYRKNGEIARYTLFVYIYLRSGKYHNHGTYIYIYIVGGRGGFRFGGGGCDGDARGKVGFCGNILHNSSGPRRRDRKGKPRGHTIVGQLSCLRSRPPPREPLADTGDRVDSAEGRRR